MEPDSADSAAEVAGPVIRASDAEREAAVRRLQDAFAEGRLGDDEFDERMRKALAARTRPDLDSLFDDLPAAAGARLAVRPAADVPGEGPTAIAYKGAIRRSGRWRVPQRMTTIAYKGSSEIDLRAAELTAAVTTVRAVSYKSAVEIIVPPGVRVVTGGFGVSRGDPDEEPGAGLSPDAPVVHVRGFSYKGSIEIRTRPRR
jgi:uncharacterized protein DUF1707